MTCLVLTALIAHLALATAPGQVVDTILMEGTMRSARHYEGFSMLITGLVSVPVMVIAGAAVACGAGGPALLRPFSRPASRSPARVSPGSR